MRQAGITVCCGGIIGMGEGRPVRYGLLRQLAALDPHPESVPINLLVRVAGTPLADLPPEDPFELVRTIATARILMPASIVRLSAGRLSLSDEAQALCFLAGANSVFLGDRLLTTPNPGADEDRRLLDKLGMRLRNVAGRSPGRPPAPRRTQSAGETSCDQSLGRHARSARAGDGWPSGKRPGCCACCGRPPASISPRTTT